MTGAIVLAASYSGAGGAGARPAQAQGTANRPIAYMLELWDTPAAALLARSSAQAGAAAQAGAPVDAAAAAVATQAQVARISAAQEAMLAPIAALNATVLYRTQRVYNGIAVQADTSQADALAALPGVKALHPIVPKVPDNATSVPFLGIPALWQGSGLGDGALAVRGDGMRIAIIDTGIDYLHVDFGGPGDGYAANNPTKLGDAPNYPGAKVIGGWDFVGDAYNADAAADDYQPLPKPDADPMDCYGHGTHVAGTAAGYGVAANGMTYRGPYDTSTDFSGFSIGPGVAPLAQIYALKIFGCTGSTNFTDDALEWAVDPNGDGDFSDHVDVVNLSLGSAYGAPYDTTAVAADNAAAAGVIVVASAGNNGNTNLVVGTPSVADRAISVAAMQHRADPLTPAGQGGDTGADFTARGPRRGDAAIKPDLAAPGIAIVSAAAHSGAGHYTASGTSMAAPHVSGFMALLRELHPSWSVEELKALAMNTAMPYVRAADSLASVPYTPVRMGAGRIDAATAVRATAVAYAEPGSGRVGLSFGAPEVQAAYTATQMVALANKGVQPLAYNVTYNSLVNTPGVAIQGPPATVSVGPGQSTEFPVTLQVDGKALRRVQSGVDQSSIMPGAWLPEESGSLILWPTAAVQLALGDGSTASLRYDAVRRTLSYTITLAQVDAGAVTGAGIQLKDAVGGSSVGTELPLDVTSGSALHGSAVLDAQMERWLAAGWLRLHVRSPAFAEGELAAPLEFNPPILHLPVYVSPRPVGEMKSAAALDFNGGLVQPLTQSGQPLTGTLPPTDVVSLASVTQLQLRSPNNRPAGLPDGVPDAYDSADLRYVGVGTDLPPWPGGRVEDETLYFAIATWADWATPNEVQFNVYIDTDRDGRAEYHLYNADRAGFNGVKRSDEFVSVLENLRNGRRTIQGPINGVGPDRYDTAPYFTNVMVLPVKAAALGLSTINSRFTYTIDTTSADMSDAQINKVDETPRLSFDAAHPLVRTVNPPDSRPLLPDQPGEGIQLQLDPGAYVDPAKSTLLVIHFHNSNGERVSLVETDYQWPYLVHLPIIRRR